MKASHLILGFLGISLFFVLAMAVEPAAEFFSPRAFAVTRENAGTFYRAFPRQTEHPYFVAPLTAILCDFPSPEAIEQERKRTGPHHQAQVHIYTNPLAQEALKKAMGFPEGSVVIKEKLDDNSQMAAVGGMIKRRSGYNRENGDWEYFYFAKTGEFSSGRLPNCIACHRAAAATDYVYGNWKKTKRNFP